jgi:hypothetical protein
MLDSNLNMIKLMAESLWNEPATGLLKSAWDPFNDLLNQRIVGDYEYKDSTGTRPDVKISYRLRYAERERDLITAKLGNFHNKQVGAMKAAFYQALMASSAQFRFGGSTVFRRELSDTVQVTFKHQGQHYGVIINNAAVMQFFLTKARAAVSHTTTEARWDSLFHDTATYWNYLGQHITIVETKVYGR